MQSVYPRLAFCLLPHACLRGIDMKGLKAVIFDMDGTLTQPYIDWKSLRAQIHCPIDKTIIEHINSLPSEASERANDILMQTEREAAQHAEINDGAV